jgi:hypothetical protein
MKYLLLTFAFLSCKSGPKKMIPPHVGEDSTTNVSVRREASGIDIHDPYETGKDTVRLNAAMDKIFKFPEVQIVDKQIRKKSEGLHGVAIMVRDEFQADTAYYDFMVGDNSHEDRYVNMFNFILEKKTGQIKVYDSITDSIMNLKDWRKTRK